MTTINSITYSVPPLEKTADHGTVGQASADFGDIFKKIIDNVNELLGDDLKSEVRPGSKLRIAASTFSIFAFEALRQRKQLPAKR